MLGYDPKDRGSNPLAGARLKGIIMYLFEKVTKDVVQRATASKPFGPAFDEERAKKAIRMEIWCSNYTDIGDDFAEFRLIDEIGLELGRKRIIGY